MKILIADSSPASKTIQKNLLNSMGQKDILEAENKDETLFIFKENPDIDMILLSSELEGNLDLETLYTIRGLQKSPDLIIILLSEDSHESQVRKVMAGGADYFIIKPIDPERFKARLSEFFSKYNN